MAKKGAHVKETKSAAGINKKNLKKAFTVLVILLI
jgi:hypothetical protein